MAIRSIAKGEFVYRKGEPCDTAFILVSGSVELSDGERSGILPGGSMFGEVSLLRGQAYGETATALVDSSLQTVSQDHLDQLLSDSPPEIQKIIRNCAQRGVAGAVAGGSGQQDFSSSDGGVGHAILSVMQGFERVTRQMEKRQEWTELRLAKLAAEASSDAGDGPAYQQLTEELVQELSNLGPIMPLLADETVNDILINGADNVYVERKGLLEKTDITFDGDAQVMEIAGRIVKAVGRKIDGKRPLVDARLLDGSRVNIIAQPLAVDGTSISIRKFSKKKITLDSMKESKNTSNGLSEFLKVVGRCRLNIVISGGTGSGKTTLLNAISQHIDNAERIVTIEDAAELQLQQPHVVRLETRPFHIGMSRDEEVSMRDLVKNALRMRPDRILVGEVRGPEAFDMMQAMNTGHEGSLTTVHANHPRDAISRLENMISMADLQIPLKSLRYQIAAALHLIVQISRMRDGHRRVTYVSEVVGMEGDIVTMHDLFNYVPTGEDDKGRITGEFKWSGIMPRFVRRVAYYGEVPRLEAAFGVKLPKNFG